MPASDHEHGAVRQILRTPVASPIGLHHGGRDAFGQLRDAQPLERAGSDDDVAGVDRPVGDRQRESAVFCM